MSASAAADAAFAATVNTPIITTHEVTAVAKLGFDTIMVKNSEGYRGLSDPNRTR